MSGYLAKYGLTLVRNGYNIIPLKPSEKIPAIEGWRETQATEKHVRKWCSNGLAEAGIGITTGVIVFLDLDIPNKVVKKLVRWAEENLGHAPARIGNPLKIGLLYRSESAIPTRLSKVYRDEQGQRCQIEILGEGRQFVACAIHPVTGRPYTWDKGFNPLAVRAEDLPVVRAADVFRIFDEFDRVAAEEGWIPASGRLPALTRNARDPDDIWNPKKPPCGYSEEKISEILMSIPNDSRFDAREDWLKIGCAVHHETDGSKFGRELWYEWSFQHPSLDNAPFDKAWDSFGMHAEDPEYAEITFRYIAKIANLIAKKVAQKKLHDLLF